MTTQALEIERKYELESALPELLFDGLPGVAAADGPQRHELDAVYYDSDDLRLAVAGVTLRRRTGGADAGWHLKLPAGAPGERLEHRLPPGRSGRTVPAPLVDLTMARTRGATLRPVVRLRTTRHQWDLMDADGTRLAEVASDDVTAQTMGGPSTISAWHELEVELAGGDRELLAAVEERLLAAGAWPSGSASKLGRALAERLAALPAGPAVPKRSAAAAVLRYLGEQVEELANRDVGLRKDEPDAVHKLRIAVRRARGALQSCRRVLDRERTASLVGELRWLGGVLATARDAQVQRERLLDHLRALPDELVVGPVVSRVDSEFLREYTSGRDAALVELRGPRYLALLDALHALLADPPLTELATSPARTVLPGEVRRAQRRVRRALTSDGPLSDDALSDDALHEARKAAKRARYAAELASGSLGKPARRTARRLKAVQQLLGEHQDSVVTGGVLRDLGMRANLAGENAFTHGVLLGQGLVRADQVRERLPAVWRRADSAKARRWLRGS